MADRPDLYQLAAAVRAYFDQVHGTRTDERVRRVLHVTEEAGEAARAMLGQLAWSPRLDGNPSHGADDVDDELADTVMAALLAMTGDPATVMARHAVKSNARLGRLPGTEVRR